MPKLVLTRQNLMRIRFENDPAFLAYPPVAANRIQHNPRQTCGFDKGSAGTNRNVFAVWLERNGEMIHGLCRTLSFCVVENIL